MTSSELKALRELEKVVKSYFILVIGEDIEIPRPQDVELENRLQYITTLIQDTM